MSGFSRESISANNARRSDRSAEMEDDDDDDTLVPMEPDDPLRENRVPDESSPEPWSSSTSYPATLSRDSPTPQNRMMAKRSYGVVRAPRRDSRGSASALGKVAKTTIAPDRRQLRAIRTGGRFYQPMVVTPTGNVIPAGPGGSGASWHRRDSAKEIRVGGARIDPEKATRAEKRNVPSPVVVKTPYCYSLSNNRMSQIYARNVNNAAPASTTSAVGSGASSSEQRVDGLAPIALPTFVPTQPSMPTRQGPPTQRASKWQRGTPISAAQQAHSTQPARQTTMNRGSTGSLPSKRQSTRRVPAATTSAAPSDLVSSSSNRDAMDWNLNAGCQCAGGEKAKLGADKTTDIIPPRRFGDGDTFPRDPNDCGESPWDWYVDAEWGCDEFVPIIDCDDDEDCPSLLEWLLCPETDECEDDDPDIEYTTSAVQPDLDLKIIYRQGEEDTQEIRKLRVDKISKQEFKVSWSHPPGPHPVYVVVVYPPVYEGAQKPRGPDCGPCVDDDECYCGTDPIFRKHLPGTAMECNIPSDMMDPDMNYIIEVATLDEKREESFGTSLVLVEVFEV